MSYEVIFKDKTSQIVPDLTGEKLKSMVLENEQPTTPIEINGNIFRLYDVASVRYSATIKRELPTVSIDHLIDAAANKDKHGNKCRAQYSIQREINALAKAEGNWTKLLRDKEWREKTRLELWSHKGVLWCDDKVKECACD